MNILFVVPYPPSLIRARSYNLIRGLTGHDHKVTIATLWSDEKELQDIQYLRELGYDVIFARLSKARSYWNCLWQLPGKLPLQAVYCWEPELLNAIMKVLRHQPQGKAFDVIHVEHLRGAQYACSIRAQAPDYPIVWDSVDSITHLFRQASRLSRRTTSRIITQFELGRTAKYEGWISRQFERTLITSPVDQQTMLELQGDHKDPDRFTIIPNGVDIDYFTPGTAGERQSQTIVLSGKMSYHANITMAFFMVRQVMPIVWKTRPELKLMIVGKDPTPEVLELGNDSRVQVTGTVQDLRPYLHQATVAVAPLTYGAGSQFKILEAMACGIPVVTTSLGISALQVTSGNELVVADDESEFAENILKLIEDPITAARIGASGRRYVESEHSWQSISRRLVDTYQLAVEAYPAPGEQNH